MLLKSNYHHFIFVIEAVALVSVFSGISTQFYTGKANTANQARPYCTLQDTKPISYHHTQEQVEKYLKCEPISIYLEENVSIDQTILLKQELTRMNGVYKITYISQEQAYNLYRKINKNSPLSLKLMPSKNAFPPSFDVYVSDPTLKNALIKKVKFGTNKAIIHTIIY